MNAAGQTVCLSMIVKNEAKVIRRCLDSVRGIVDHWVIVDTGSTDGTQDIIRAHFKDVPGELFERPWKDFAHNRSEALELARPRADYSFIIDADDLMELEAGYQLPELSADSYTIDIQDTNIRYQRTQMVRNTLPWRYAGVLHEFLTCEGAGPSAHLPIVMRRNHDGARRNDPTTYQKDAAVLEAALAVETDPFLISRYTFYLAQSYRDCGQNEKALETYLARAELGYWHEERFVALLYAARIMEALERPAEEILATYARATKVAPERAEALHGAARYCRFKDRFEEGYQFANEGLKVAKPGGGLFVETWVYDYGLLDEIAVCGYWAQRYQESFDACQKLLELPNLPGEHRGRIIANADFSKARLAEKAEALKPIENATGGKQLKIAVYTIALNEAKHVDRWCKSTEEADYRVVADTGSTDGTADLLRERGVQVSQITIRPWRFDDARNANLALVPSDADICISLDMDEFMLPGWRAALEAAWLPGTTRLFYSYARGIKPDGAPDKIFRRGKIHSRRGYRWKRILHEDLSRVEPDERTADTHATLMAEIQDGAKDRSQYLPLMEQSHAEDPNDAQLCFWLARELMYAGQNERAAEIFLKYLALPHWTWADERAEAMRYLARVQPEKKLFWLQKSIVEAGHRRELWHELAEHYHAETDWLNVLWACGSGIEKTRLTGTYLDDPNSWGYRLHDLAALACSHLGIIEKAISYGEEALEKSPSDTRLANNLSYYRSQLASRKRQYFEEQIANAKPPTLLGQLERVINLRGHVVTLESACQLDEPWQLVVIALPGHIHSAALAELAQFVYYGLQLAGKVVYLNTHIKSISHRSIVIGAHLLSADECRQIPSSAIIYNSEHHKSDFFVNGSSHFLPHYIELLRRACVWDFDHINATAMSAMVGRSVKYVALGYVPQFTKIPKGPEDIDVLFYGSIKSRRERVLTELSNRGLNVHSTFGTYGVERDKLIARSKVVLNIHGNLPGSFESSRVVYLLANKKAVVTECNDGESIEASLKEGLIAVPYENIVDAVFELVRDDVRRNSIEAQGFLSVRSLSAKDLIEDAMNALDGETNLLPDRGASDVVIYSYFEKEQSYQDNFRYFLAHGIVDTVDYIVVINGLVSVELPELPNVRYVFRENVGFDFGAYCDILNTVLQERVYHRYIFINCTVVGPLNENKTGTWTDAFTEALQGDVVLSGISINVLPKESPAARAFSKLYDVNDNVFPHVQSMAFCMTRECLEFLIKTGFFVNTEDLLVTEVIVRFELRMSYLVLRNGWNISCSLKRYQGIDYRTVQSDFNPTSLNGDPWYPGALFGESVDASEVRFWKTNRNLPLPISYPKPQRPIIAISPPGPAVEAALEGITTAWRGHRRLAEWLVRRIRPAVIADLGVDYGFSTLCFAGANIGHVYGIDSFEGDEHAGYRDTLPIVKRQMTGLGINNITLIKGYFSTVAKSWTKKIQILHIDGLHTYDAIREDYEVWSKFVDPFGVILLHDTCVPEFGVRRLFDQIQTPKLNLRNSHGLGIISHNENLLGEIKLEFADLIDI